MNLRSPVLLLNIRVSHPRRRLRWEMAQGQPTGPKKILWNWKWSRIPVLQNTREFFILHTRREWKTFCIHEDRRIVSCQEQYQEASMGSPPMWHFFDGHIVLCQLNMAVLDCPAPFNRYHRMAFPSEIGGNFFQRRVDQHVCLSFSPYSFDPFWLLVLSFSSWPRFLVPSGWSNEDIKGTSNPPQNQFFFSSSQSQSSINPY